MENTQEGVETKPETALAPATGVETKPALAPEEDPEAKLASLIEENEKLARDRDNYRAAALGKKGAIAAEELDLQDPVQLNAYIDRKVNETVLATREAAAQKEYAEYTKRMARELKEAKLALANKTTMGPTSSGSGESSSSEVKTGYFSKEQLTEFKKRGWDDAKIKKAEENMRRQKQ